MKKLLVTAIGAAAALGAFAAGEISLLRFEDMERGGTTISALNTAQGTYWSADQDATNNTYEIVERAEAIVARQETAISQAPTNALSVKTTFGKPLSVNVVDGGTATNINAGLYFDSLVKFTVCEDEPVTTNYNGAKIVMWLQEEYNGDDIVRTNLMVNAGYLTVDQNVLQVSNAVYNCGEIAGDFADKFHRVTIKAIGNITTGNTPVPGFAIYIDGSDDAQIGGLPKGTSEAKWDSSFTAAYTLTEAAADLASSTKGALFPSLDQSSPAMSTLTAASFDGTGSLSDIIFTANAPDFAKDYAAPKVSVTVNNSVLPPYSSFDEAMTFVNAQAAGANVEVMLLKGMTIDGTLAFASAANVTLDFAGVVLTNESASAPAISNSGTLTITNSIEAAVGGIVCVDANGVALLNSGLVYIKAGMFNGNIEFEGYGDAEISGGSFKQDAFNLGSYVVEGKELSYNTATGLYDVVDKATTYTVIFVYGLNGEYATTNDNLAADAEMPLPPAAATIAGYTTTWTPALPSTVQADGTYTASYSADSYTITFNANGGSVDPATTNFTIESGAIVLPTATTSLIGVTFAGWTNDTITTAITSFTPTAADLANFTLFAKWDAVAPSVITFETGRNDATVTPATTNFFAGGATITLPTPVLDAGVVGVTFAGWTNATITTAITEYTPPAANAESFTLYAKWDMVVGPTYPSYIDTSDAKVKGQYDTWAETWNVTDGEDLEKAFLLNINPQLGLAQLTSTAVSISGTTVTININYGNLNGYPYVKKAATVAGLKTAIPSAVTVVPADNIENGGIVELTASGDAQFYQIGVQSAPVAVPNP